LPVIVSFLFLYLLLLVLRGGGAQQDGILTTVAFVTGAATSMIAGYVGMKVAVFSNARTTKVNGF
jgi:inorganic pyrophosphatase